METLPEPIERKNQRDIIVEVLNDTPFTAREREVVHRRYFEGCTLRELGEGWGVCTEIAGRVERELLRKLRHPVRRYLFEELAGKPLYGARA